MLSNEDDCDLFCYIPFSEFPFLLIFSANILPSCLSELAGSTVSVALRNILVLISLQLLFPDTNALSHYFFCLESLYI